MSAIRNFFFVPASSPRWRRLLPFALVALGIVFVLLAIPPAWEYTNSAAFCGTTCHTMPPEYNLYLVSPHARVPCVDCHIGRDLLAVQFFRKSGHIRLVLATALDNYHYPIQTGEMRPARDTCEHCHFPEKFSDDSLRVINGFETDRENTPYSTYLLMHTGGGSEREGLGRGIHWHVEQEITYIATDSREQEIPWVRVANADGTYTDYNAVNSPIDTENLDQYETHEMDCLACHNRIAHLIETPTDLVNSALSQGDLSTEIPFIRSRAVELLAGAYASNEAAHEAIDTLEQYYSEYYPEFYEAGSEQVAEAIDLLKTLYDNNNYPEQMLDWETHPNNIGHLETPGCFRCHDGQHFSESGEVIRLECNLCHSIPVVTRPGDIEPMIPLSTGLEPASHLDSTWISRHHDEFDASCANCHTTGNAGGTDDSSFCANSGCHGTEWRFAGFNAPGMATMLGIYQVELEPLLQDFEGDPTYAVLEPLFAQQCAGCHGATPSKGLRVTDYASLLAGSESGPVIVPGAPEESQIVQVLSDGHFAQFTDHQMDLLRQWISDGVPAE
jgi:mono/diheme cytochrome c family protein